METSIARHIDKYLKEHQHEMIAFLKRLVACETPSKDKSSQFQILKILETSLSELGFYTILFPGKKTGGYLFARPLVKEGNGIQLMIGHCDTVWKLNTIDSMPIKEINGKISGPGIFDMKAGITQMIFALKSLQEIQAKMDLCPVILINSDEEIGSFESTTAIRRISKIARRAFILEPPLGFEGKLKTARKGIGKFVIRVRGKPAHAGLNPGEGVSAIVELSYQIQNLFQLNDFEKGITVNVGMIEGGSSANVIAEESQAVVDVRVYNLEDARAVEKKILSLRPKHKGTSISIEGGFGRPPMERTERNQKLWKLAKEIGLSMELSLEETTAGGGSDGNTTSLYTATLDGLGTVGDGAHARHEFIFKEKLIERTTLLAMLLANKDIEQEIIVSP
ncbi:M20 family metallopeptidase [Lutimonas zeaxanthinifaciens]|uniref:M20 family metallopeptidase n=1 Tax=Lutimonas zeaxanthinifaciens TaxID=3060215 RepID=UPI00265CA924|nr:M20 family metallopeptidase [Lutimonas sp. YSD2104]WKK66266.1 M20 family metallopeptidase [Lutimonas sp. YSD2104]